MARKHLVFDPGDEEWCVMARIGTIDDGFQVKIAFYSTEEECKESAKNLQESSKDPVDFRIFRYSYPNEESDIPETPVPRQRQPKDQNNRRTNRVL